MSKDTLIQEKRYKKIITILSIAIPIAVAASIWDQPPKTWCEHQATELFTSHLRNY